MSFQFLETCLSSAEKNILKYDVFSTINLFKNSSYYESFLIQKDNFDFSSILDEAEYSYSPLRVSSLLCLLIACSDDIILNQKYFLRLTQSLIEANLYNNALEIINRYKSYDYIFSRLALFACLKTERWNLLLQFYYDFPKALVTDDIRLIFTRALLEQDRPFEAYSCLLEISSNVQNNSRTYYILLLTVKQKLGQLNSEDFNKFLGFIVNASHLEKIALAGLWTSFESFITADVLYSESFSVLLNNFWYSISTNTLLADGFRALPSLVHNKQINRIAISTNNISLLPILQNIAYLLQNRDPIIKSVDIIFLGDLNTSDNRYSKIINICENSITASIHTLRNLKIDVLIDTIGTSNSRWLEIVAQQVSTYQIGWFPLDFASFFAPLYDFVIVDRWTKPKCLNYIPIKLLEFSGISTLSTDTCDDQSLTSTNVQTSVDTFIIPGRPDQLMPGSQQLIKSLLVRYPEVTFQFIDSVWQESGLLDFWWSSVYSDQPAPNQFNSPIDINISRLSQRSCYSLILSFYQGSPTHQLSYLLSNGIPIVCLLSDTIVSCSIHALLDSLGLASFITENVDRFCDIVDAILLDSELRTEISMKLPHQFKTSLTLNHQLFASDLYQSLSLLSG